MDQPVVADSSEAETAPPATFEFILMDAFSMLSVIAAIEPLRVANRLLEREVYGWSLSSEDGAPVTASSGLRIDNVQRIGEGATPDYCFVCAGMTLTAQHPTRLSAFLQKRRKSGAVLGAISMGAIFLARAGLLRDVRCTIHWEGRPAFCEEFPDIELSSAIYEMDQGVLTCAGGQTSFDMILALIAKSHPDWCIRSIANQLQVDRVRSGVLAQNSGSNRTLENAPKQMKAAIELIHQNMEHPMDPDSLAEAVGTSRRTLERLFFKHTGFAPSRFCKLARLEAAKDLLLHSSLSVLEISIATGFSSASYFSFSFSEHFGRSPSELRRGAS